jgi:hypothetical protein
MQRLTEAVTSWCWRYASADEILEDGLIPSVLGNEPVLYIVLAAAGGPI